MAMSPNASTRFPLSFLSNYTIVARPSLSIFLFNDTPTPEIYTLSLHDALPISEAEMHFRLAIQRQTKRNPNPAEGDAYYYLGLTLQYQERLEEAYTAYYKAVWNYAWQSAAYYQLAEIKCRRLDFDRALEHLEQSLKTNTEHLKAHNLRTAILRKLGAHAEATKYAQGTHALDPVDSWSRHELAALSAKKSRLIEQSATGSGTRTATQLHLDLALDYAAAGYWADARDV